MKAWLLDSLDGIDRLRLAEIDDPVPGAGEVVLDVRYAALNPADRYLAENQYPARPPLPHILGRDGMGVISDVGAAVTGWKTGDRAIILRSQVGVSRPGTLAERTAVPAESLAAVPEGWSEPEASCATLVYLTAYQALSQWGALLPGTVVLVTGASGGVGVASVQLGRAMEYRVVALSRSAEKGKRLIEMGAEMWFDPNDSEWRKRAKERLAPQRVDLAIDNIGGTLLPQVIDTLGDLGKVSIVGRLAGPVPQFNTASLFFRRIRLGGVAVGAYTAAQTQEAWRHVQQLLGTTGARPIVDRVFPFDAAREAFWRLAEGPMGKVVVEVK